MAQISKKRISNVVQTFVSVSGKVRANWRRTRPACSMWRGGRCFPGCRERRTWFLAQCCLEAWRPEAMRAGDLGCLSTPCRCELQLERIVQRPAFDVCIRSWLICFVINKHHWSWPSGAVQFPPQRHCFPRCSTIVTKNSNPWAIKLSTFPKASNGFIAKSAQIIRSPSRWMM